MADCRVARAGAYTRGRVERGFAVRAALGEHTDTILAELGLDPTTIAALRADGAI